MSFEGEVVLLPLLGEEGWDKWADDGTVAEEDDEE